VPSADALKELHDDLKATGVQLVLVRLHPAVRDLLDRSGVSGAIGEEHIFTRVLGGAIFHLCQHTGEADAFGGLSRGALRRLRRIVDGLLVNAEGDERVQLQGLSTRLSSAIDETKQGSYHI